MKVRFNAFFARTFVVVLCTLASVVGLQAQIGPTGGTFTTCSGTFTDPGGAGDYANGANITYTIQPTSPATQRTSVTFNSYVTESQWDFLRIYDGTSSAAPLITLYTDVQNGGPFTITASQGNTSGALTFVFTSDTTVTAAGWDATVNCVPVASAPSSFFQGGGNLTTTDAAIQDPGTGTPAGYYAGSLAYNTVVCAPSTNQLIRATFAQFQTESGFDFLTVYDGNSTAAPVIFGPSSGNTLPPVLTASPSNPTGCLTFRFTSDAIIARPGYLAQISAVARPFCDLIAPTIPAFIASTPGVCGFRVANTSLDATLNGTDCNTASLRNSFNNSSTLNGATLPTGSTTVTWSVLSTGGVLLTTTVTYVVRDTELPSFNACPASPFIVNLGPGECNRTLTFDLSASDNCGNGPLVQRAITQNGMTSVIGSVICGNNNSLEYMRRYNNGFGDDLRIASVDAGIQSSPAGKTITATVYRLNGALLNANLTAVASATFNITTAITTANMQIVNIPISAVIPAGADYVVGITYPDDSVVAGFSNTAQTSPTFVRGCNLAFLVEPTNIANLGFTQSFNLRVNGTTGNLTLTQNSALGSGSTFPIGITPVSYTVTDAAGNSRNCIFNVDVRPFTNPASVKCNDNVQISLDEDCSVAIGADDILEGGPYRCYDTYIVQVDRTAPYNNGPWANNIVTNADAGKTLGVRIIDDVNGNGRLDAGENTCWGTILVEDKLPPVLSCLPFTAPCNVNTAPGSPVTLPLSFASANIVIPATGTVNSTINVSLPPGTIVGMRVKVVTNHTWVGDIALDITSPGGVTRRMFDRPGVPASGFGCAGIGLNVTFDDNAATPHSVFESTCGNNPAISGTFQPFQTLAPYLAANTNGAWNVLFTDSAAPDGATATTVTLEFIVNTTFPLINGLFVAPGSGVTQIDGKTFVVAAGAGTPRMDNCSNVTLSYIDSKTDIDCPSPLTGTIARKWTAIDASGRTSTCVQTLNLLRPTLADLVAPVNFDGIGTDPNNASISCLDGRYPTPAVLTGLGRTRVTPTVFNSTTGCSIGWDYVDVRIPVCDGTYKIRRKWTAIDWCTSQEREFTQIINVMDNAGPVLECDRAPVAGDEIEIRADGSDAGRDPDTFRVFRRAVAPLEGGIFQRIQNGALTGTQQNTIGFYANVDFGKCCASVDMPDFIVSDGCSRVKSISAMITGIDPLTNQVIGMFELPGTIGDFQNNNWWVPDTMARVGRTACLPLGAHDVVYTVTDDCGNASTCSFKLFILDEKPPVVAADRETEISIGYNDPEDCYPGSPADSLADRNACKTNGVAWIPARNFDDGSFDNCGPIRFTIRRMPDTTIRIGNATIDQYSPFIESLNKRDGCVICDPDDDFLFSTDFGRTVTDPFDLFLTTQFKPTEYQRAIFEQDSIKFYCDEVGTRQTVILRVYQVDDNGAPRLDRYGNRVFNEAMIQVYIRDKTRPSCVAPPNVTVNCENFDPSLWAYGQASTDDNCCLDINKVYQGKKGISHTANYALFDTVCQLGTITRTFTSYDCSGNTSVCSQRVVVTPREFYFVRFPDDRIITKCDGTGQYGAPTFFGEDCELLATSFRDDTFTVVQDACFKIERHWKVINWCTYDPNCPLTYVPNPSPNVQVNASANLPGPIVSNIDGCLQANALNPWRSACVRINPTDVNPTSYTVFHMVAQNCPQKGRLHFNGYEYTQIIKIIDTEKPTAPCVKPDTCDLTENDPAFWNRDYWWDAKHESHDLCEMPIDLKLTATDACSGPNVGIRYLLFLDLDNNGTMETVINSVSPPPTNTVYYGNATNPNYAGGTARAFDHRIVNNPSLDWYRFAIQYTTSGATRTAAVRFNTVRNPGTYALPQLPHGRHKIKWIYDDGCGNEQVCEYPFEIRDCKKPTIVCKPLSINIMQTGMVTIWASDFLEYGLDNCTPSGQLKYSISTGETPPSTFPLDANGNPITSVTFDCTQLGPNVIQLWAQDRAGNADFCQVILLVQDNMGNCVQKATVAGELKTEAIQGVQDGTVELSGSHVAALPLHLFRKSGQDGKYDFSAAVPILGSYTLTPVRDDNPLNGVTTLDLALISKHILNLSALNSPYKLIAADANKSGTITTLDIVALRRLILGIDQELQNNNSWRFVDKSYVFPNPQNPFTKAFPETKTVAEVRANQMNENFVGMKIGDVNGTAQANGLMGSDDRTTGTLMFDIEDRTVKAGEVVEVKFRAAERVTGYQFTLNHVGLEVMDIVPGSGMGMDNFAVFNQESALTTSFNGDVAGEFTVKFRVQQAGSLSKMLGVSSRITKAIAYDLNEGGEQIALRFNNNGVTTIAGLGFELYQNQPNPFVSSTVIGFHLPEAAKATLTVYDESGRVVFTQKGEFAKGYNHFALSRELVPTTGLLYYKVETEKESATRKMIQTK